MPAPDTDLLQRLLDGTLAPAEAREVEQRLESDPDWQNALEQLSGLPHLTSEYLRPARNSPREDRSDAVLDLIDRLKAEPPAATEDRSWRDILTPPPEPNPDNLLGTLGDYEILELLAEGGMGLVFKARDSALNRIVALKALAPRLATNATARERFLREARAVAALEHENILPIHSVHEGDESGGVPWFAMRFATGSTLEDLLESQDGPLPLDRVCSIARQAADALAAAHAKGIIHRDIKPGNILLDDESDQIWIADFGLARSTEDPTLTYPGMVAGTPQFMAPEQVEGLEIDHRSDLFSLGAVLYRCATGQAPFGGKTSASVMRNVAHTEPTLPSRHNPSLPSWFRRLLQSLLAKNPAHRLPSASAVREAIEKQRAPRSRMGRRRKILVILGLAILLLAALPLLLFVPAVAYWANTKLANEERPFFNTRRFGLHPTLASAVEDARPGEIIEVRTDATLRLSSSIRIPSGKRLTIRAARGFTPRLDATPCHEPFLVTEGEVRLERLTLLREKSGPSPLLIATSGHLLLDRCSVIAEGIRQQPQNAQVLQLHPGAHLELRDSNILTSWTFVITIPPLENREGDVSVTVDNCNLTGYSLLAIGGFEKGKVEFALHHSVFTGPAIFFPSPRHPLPELTADVTHSAFNTDAALWWIPQNTLVEFQEKVRWRGRRNLYKNGLAYLRTGRTPDRRSGPAQIGTLTDWQALPTVDCEDSLEGPSWSSRDSEDGLPSNIFDVTIADLKAVGGRFLDRYPDIGPDLDLMGPNGNVRTSAPKR